MTIKNRCKVVSCSLQIPKCVLPPVLTLLLSPLSIRRAPLPQQASEQQPQYGSFLQPPGAGLDSAADLQQFGSPAIPGGGLGAGLQV